MLVPIKVLKNNNIHMKTNAQSIQENMNIIVQWITIPKQKYTNSTTVTNRADNTRHKPLRGADWPFWNIISTNRAESDFAHTFTIIYRKDKWDLHVQRIQAWFEISTSIKRRVLIKKKNHHEYKVTHSFPLCTKFTNNRLQQYTSRDSHSLTVPIHFATTLILCNQNKISDFPAP